MEKELISGALLIRKWRQTQFEGQENSYTENTPVTGEFVATREELHQIMLSQHEAKIDGLARYVLKLRTKEERRKWLDQFANKHDATMVEELKARIIEMNKGKPRPGVA